MGKIHDIFKWHVPSFSFINTGFVLGFAGLAKLVRYHMEKRFLVLASTYMLLLNKIKPWAKLQAILNMLCCAFYASQLVSFFFHLKVATDIIYSKQFSVQKNQMFTLYN